MRACWASGHTGRTFTVVTHRRNLLVSGFSYFNVQPAPLLQNFTDVYHHFHGAVRTCHYASLQPRSVPASQNKAFVTARHSGKRWAHGAFHTTGDTASCRGNIHHALMTWDEVKGFRGSARCNPDFPDGYDASHFTGTGNQCTTAFRTKRSSTNLQQ